MPLRIPNHYRPKNVFVNANLYFILCFGLNFINIFLIHNNEYSNNFIV